LSATAAALRETTGPQHLEALSKANAVRLARAGLKRKIAVGEMTAAEVVLSCPWEVESMTVADLVTSQRRWGSTRCRKLLLSLKISETRLVGSLTTRQRVELAGRLRAGGAAESISVL